MNNLIKFWIAPFFFFGYCKGREYFLECLTWTLSTILFHSWSVELVLIILKNIWGKAKRNDEHVESLVFSFSVENFIFILPDYIFRINTGSVLAALGGLIGTNWGKKGRVCLLIFEAWNFNLKYLMVFYYK